MNVPPTTYRAGGSQMYSLGIRQRTILISLRPRILGLVNSPLLRVGQWRNRARQTGTKKTLASLLPFHYPAIGWGVADLEISHSD